MIEQPRFVQHVTSEEVDRRGLKGQMRDTDRIVIPAKNEEKTIGSTLGDLLGKCRPSQITVLVNGTTDNTVDVIRHVSSEIVIEEQRTIIDADAALLARLHEGYGITAERLRGKGTAMFAASLALERSQTPDDARIFFLDADITNFGQVDPIGRLLIGWELWHNTVDMVKLASLGRDNAGIHAFLGVLGKPYGDIGALQWPLCGQVSLRWGDLKRMRLATGYAVEMAMMMDLVERHGTPEIFGEVEISEHLDDKRNSDQIHTRMYRAIMAFIGQIWTARPPKKQLHALSAEEITAMNRNGGASFYVPVGARGEGPNQFESHRVDAILPSVAELLP